MRGRKKSHHPDSKLTGINWVLLSILLATACLGSILGTYARKSSKNNHVQEPCPPTVSPRVLPLGIDELQQCPQAATAKRHAPSMPPLEKEVHLQLNGTKWAGGLAIPPKVFFDTWLKQYPPNTASAHPVLLFAHERGIRHGSSRAKDFCRVMDVALVPDRPGLCTSITETNHDMASYHMLVSEVAEDSATNPKNYHQGVQADGQLEYVPRHHLSSNSMNSRSLPKEAHYARARDAYDFYFDHEDEVARSLREHVPIHNASEPGYRRTQWVGCVVMDTDEADLFYNSVITALNLGVNFKKFWAFTPYKHVRDHLAQRPLPKRADLLGVQVVLLKNLEDFAKGKMKADMLTTHFLQAWLAFALADQGSRMLWQSPATAWLERPDRLVNRAPDVEIISVYKGRRDPNSEPFYPSFDFIALGTEPRVAHLLHEVVMHFDLALAWESLDALLSYRLAEGNARYGTSVAVLDPAVVMHGDVFVEDEGLKAALLDRSKKPMAVALSREDTTPAQAKSTLQELGHWHLT